MIRLHILGSASGMPELNKHHAAIMFSYNNKNLLIDAGEGVSQQLLKYGYDKDFLDDIIITHFHPDHISGVFMLLQMLYLQERTKDLRLFIPEDIGYFSKMLEAFYLFPVKFKFKLQILTLNKTNEIHSEIKIIPNSHLEKYKELSTAIPHSYKNHSILINAEKKILYTSDIPDFSSFSEKDLKVDLIILDALHPPSSKIKDFIETTKARVILNHGLTEEFKNAKYETADETKTIFI